MTETAWVALISAGAALVTALLTQFLAIQAARKQADRSERQQERAWQRSEATRREEMAQAEAKRREALRDVRLRELWGHVLTARWRVLDLLERVPVQGHPTPEASAVSAESLPENAAALAYAVALLGLADVRANVRDFYVATTKFQIAVRAADGERMKGAAAEWKLAYQALEDQVAALVPGTSSPNG